MIQCLSARTADNHNQRLLPRFLISLSVANLQKIFSYWVEVPSGLAPPLLASEFSTGMKQEFGWRAVLENSVIRAPKVGLL
jgi:hypothetical protein